jgi:hypothetical protein
MLGPGAGRLARVGGGGGGTERRGGFTCTLESRTYASSSVDAGSFAIASSSVARCSRSGSTTGGLHGSG